MTNITVGAVGGVGFITSPKHGVPGFGGDGAWRGAGWPGGPAPPGAAARRGKLRSAAPRAGTAAPGFAAGRGEGGEAPFWGTRGGTERPDRSPRPRRGWLGGTAGGGFGDGRARRRPPRSRADRALTGALPALLPPGSISPAGPPPEPAVGPPAPSGGKLRGHPRSPTGRAGAGRSGPGMLSRDSLPSPASRLRAASEHCVQGTGRCIPTRLISLSAPPPLLFPFSYLLFTPLFLAFPWNSCRLFPDTSIPTEGSSWRQFCAPCSLGDAPHQTRERLVKEVPQPPLPFQSIPETSSGAPRVTSSM